MNKQKKEVVNQKQKKTCSLLRKQNKKLSKNKKMGC